MITPTESQSIGSQSLQPAPTPKPLTWADKCALALKDSGHLGDASLSLSDLAAQLDSVAAYVRESLDDAGVLAWMRAKHEASGIPTMDARAVAWGKGFTGQTEEFRVSAESEYARGDTFNEATAELLLLLASSDKRAAERKRQEAEKLLAEADELDGAKL